VPYATKADMISLFGEPEVLQLTDRESLGEIDDTTLEMALASADGEIDSYISAVYTLPLSSTTRMLIVTSCNIARFRLYAHRATEEVKIRYDDSIRWLRDIAKGVATLGLPTTGDPLINESIVVNSRNQVFTDDVFDKMNLA
jgi:phage gp36-like protein